MGTKTVNLQRILELLSSEESEEEIEYIDDSTEDEYQVNHKQIQQNKPQLNKFSQNPNSNSIDRVKISNLLNNLVEINESNFDSDDDYDEINEDVSSKVEVELEESNSNENKYHWRKYKLPKEKIKWKEVNEDEPLVSDPVKNEKYKVEREKSKVVRKGRKRTKQVVQSDKEDNEEYEDELKELSYKWTKMGTKQKKAEADRNLRCVVCDKRIENKQLLMFHMQIHDGKEETECVLCEQNFDTIFDLIQHYDSYNNENDEHYIKFRPFVCKICGYRYKQSRYLFDHMSSHEPEGAKTKYLHYLCDKCGKQFIHTQQLDNHLAYHDKPYSSCERCGLYLHFRTEREYNVHLREVHKENVYKCHLCDKIYARNHELQQHIKNHFLEENRCAPCDLAFSCKKDFLYHMREIHTVAKQSYFCSLCGREFPYHSAYQKHLEYHKLERDCDICQEEFRTILDMHRHKRVEHDIIVENSREPKQFQRLLTEKEKKRARLRKTWNKKQNDKKKVKNSIKIEAECDICQQQFRKTIEMHRHKRIEHDIIVVGSREPKHHLKLLTEKEKEIARKKKTWNKTQIEKFKKNKKPEKPNIKEEIVIEEEKIQEDVVESSKVKGKYCSIEDVISMTGALNSLCYNAESNYIGNPENSSITQL